MSEFFSWLFTTDHLQDFSILTLCFCIVMSGRAIDRHNRQISKLQREVRELTRRCNEPEFADLFYAYGVLDSGRFIGESSHLVGLGSNQASFYLRA